MMRFQVWFVTIILPDSILFISFTLLLFLFLPQNCPKELFDNYPTQHSSLLQTNWSSSDPLYHFPLLLYSLQSLLHNLRSPPHTHRLHRHLMQMVLLHIVKHRSSWSCKFLFCYQLMHDYLHVGKQVLRVAYGVGEAMVERKAGRLEDHLDFIVV